jgi:hypothetical protein
MYLRHPSKELNALFEYRPFQGCDPLTAVFLFVGLDANYDKDIENSTILQEILNYHSNGVEFWRRCGVHHPFLLSHYRGDGRRYHSNFARIGFKAEHAQLISFIELLHVPTVGRNKLEVTDLDSGHLAYLQNTIFEGNAKHIFVSAGVLRLMLATNQFDRLERPKHLAGPLPLLYSKDDRCVYLHLHFSNYGKFQAQMDLEAQAIRKLIIPSDAC